jgi:hypothetical protein
VRLHHCRWRLVGDANRLSILSMSIKDDVVTYLAYAGSHMCRKSHAPLFSAEKLTIRCGPPTHASVIYEIQMPANNNQGAVRMQSRLPASMAFLARKDVAEPPGLTATIRTARSRTSKPMDIITTQNAASAIFRAVAPVHIPTKNEHPGSPFRASEGWHRIGATLHRLVMD